MLNFLQYKLRELVVFCALGDKNQSDTKFIIVHYLNAKIRIMKQMGKNIYCSAVVGRQHLLRPDNHRRTHLPWDNL